MTKYIQRKEIARAAEVSVNTVRNNEQRWGLMRVKGFRQARYIRNEAQSNLTKQGIKLD